jgi:hypothetical protein
LLIYVILFLSQHGHPVIDLSILNNIGAWISARRILRRVGYRFQQRWQAYALVAQILWVIFLIELIALVASEQDPGSLRSSPAFYQG